MQNKKADELRERTYQDMIRLLQEDGRCAVIRPTGFGKTSLLTRLLKAGLYVHPLYIYPAEVVRGAVNRFYYEDYIPEDGEIPGVEFMTNAKFSRLSESEIMELGQEYDIVILDECHKMGGEKTAKNLDMLLDMFPGIALLGATATPERTDAIDVIGRYFNTSRVFDYNIHDAFQDGILQKPYYVFCSYAKPGQNLEMIKQDWQAELDKIDVERDKLALADELSNKQKELAKIYNMDKAIRRNCDKYVDTEYMKFIVFFPRFEALHSQEKKVRGWFEKAYPDHKIQTLTITSETTETSRNVKRLDKLKHRKNGIDLIFAVDMLNMGYHVDSLTGIVMYRGTTSNIIYVQELGRVLSTGTDKPAIVFDVVDNLHNHALYEVLGQESIYTKNARERKEFLEKKAKKWDAFIKKHSVSVSTEDLRKASADKAELEKDIEKQKAAGASDVKLAKLQAKLNEAEALVSQLQMSLAVIDASAREYFEGKGLDEVEFTRKDQLETNSLERRFDNSGHTPADSSQIKPEDLIVVDEEASYRDMIRKLVAEPIAFRANQAWQNYLENGGKYRDEEGNLFTRKDQFLALVPPENLPLGPFCKVKRVTVDDVMEYVLGFTESVSKL